MRPDHDYYLCRTKTQARLLTPGERCPARSIPARALEEPVWRDLCEVLSAPDMIAHAMERARGGHWIPQELQARQANLRRGRAALSQQVERLTEAYLAGVVPCASLSGVGAMPRPGCRPLNARSMTSCMMRSGTARRPGWQPMPRRSAAVFGRAWRKQTSIRSGRCSNC